MKGTMARDAIAADRDSSSHREASHSHPSTAQRGCGHPEKVKLRQQLAEHPFGALERWGAGPLLVSRLEESRHRNEFECDGLQSEASDQHLRRTEVCFAHHDVGQKGVEIN